jgi:hypothetical protein
MAQEIVGIKIETDTRSLRSQFKEAMAELAKLQNQAGASAKEIANAAKRAAELKDRIGDAKDTIDAFNPDAKFRAFGQSIAGVAGAFSAAQGALALFGIENENVAKQILKVQSALALSEGLNTILGSIDGFKNLALVIKTEVVDAFSTLRGAILTSGLGILAIALSEGYYLWEKYSEGIEDVRKKLKQFQDDTARGAEAQKTAELDALERLRKNAINEAKLRGAKEEEVAAIEEKFARLKVKTLARLTEEVRGNTEIQKGYEKELQTAKDGLRQKEVDDQLKRDAESLARQEAKADKEIALEQEREKRLFEIGKIGSPEYEQKLADLTLQYQSDLKLFDDNESAKLLITRKYQEQAFELYKENRSKLTAEEEKQVDDRFNKLDKQATKEIGERNKTNTLISKAFEKNQKKIAEDEIKIDKAAKLAKLQIFADSFAILSGFAEQGSDLQKGLALAQVAIDTGIAISNLTATSSAPTADNVASGGISGFAKYATGIIKILANIATAKNIIESAPGGSGSSATMSMPSVDTSAPVYPTYLPPQATTLDQRSLNTISNVVARAYVVESDISGVTKRISRIENAARI